MCWDKIRGVCRMMGCVLVSEMRRVDSGEIRGWVGDMKEE